MTLSSYQLAEMAKYVLDSLKKVREKVEFYAQDELKKRKGSNFSLEIDENYDIHLYKIQRVLSDRENIVIETELAEKLQEFYSQSKQKFEEFDELLEKIHSQENGSHDSAFFYLPFSRWCVEFISYIKSAYGIFIDKIEIQDIIKEKNKYEKLLKDAEQKTDAFQKMLNDAQSKSEKMLENAKVKTDELLLQMQQKVVDNKVLDIKEIYESLKGQVKKSCNWNCWLFYGLSVILLSILSLAFFFYDKIYCESFWIQRSVLFISFVGFLTFLIHDFRRRYNINKQILDEIEQKKLVVDSYSSLLSRIDSFDDEIKKNYHNKIINNIVSTLLAIRNHGYVSKMMNQNDGNIVNTIVDGAAKIFNGNKG